MREQREEVLKRIRSQENVNEYLSQALELELHKGQQVIELEPGITLNVPEYVRAQCSKYGIKIPE